MPDRLDIEPLFFAPFVSSGMRVEPQWIDYNGHLNMAYYNVFFDRALDEMFVLLGMSAAYVKQRRLSIFTAEVHLRYLREVHREDPVRVSVQLLDYDSKRLHCFQKLCHATDDWLSATSEVMALHVDLEAKKTSPFPEEIANRLAQLKAAHAKLPPPEGVGRRIIMPAKA
jgi:acyl-CoA thioester hydrolase